MKKSSNTFLGILEGIARYMGLSSSSCGRRALAFVQDRVAFQAQKRAFYAVSIVLGKHSGIFLPRKTSLLRRLQAQTLPDAALPIGKVHQFSKIAVTLEPVMQFTNIVYFMT